MVADYVVKAIGIFLFVSDGYIILDFFRCNDKIVHDGNSDFVESEWYRDNDSIGLSCFVGGILGRNRALDNFEGNCGWVKSVGIAVFVNNLNDF